MKAPARAKRATSRGAADFLPEVLRFCPPEQRARVEAVFGLGRALRRAERGDEDGEDANNIGIFIDMVECAAGEWRDVGRIVIEGEGEACR
jgi:hypothetical protein